MYIKSTKTFAFKKMEGFDGLSKLYTYLLISIQKSVL
jgi:hypothetical protein